LRAHWLTLLQQLRHRLLDACLTRLRRQLQHPQVLTIGAARIVRLQRVVGTPKRQRRVQIRAIHVTRERPRLAHQPVNHVPIVDPMLRHATQTFHGLHQRTRVPHRNRLGADARFHLFTPQPRRHRVRVLLHLHCAALAHTHLLSFHGLQPALGQAPQPTKFFLEFVAAARVPHRRHATHQLPVLLPAAEVPAATQQQFLLDGLLEASMALFAVPVLVTAVGIGGFSRYAVVTHEALVSRRVPLDIAVLMHGQRHAIGAVTLRHGAKLPHGVLPALAQTGEAFRKA
jgi:hypothetical protein